ncbi:MAG TPA: phosphatase PAP2 family protein, partial [Candidatus Acidoferrales bacterium]
PSSVNYLVSVGSNHLRNCFPSMHFAWAFLLALGVKDWRWRWAFILYAILMVLAPVAGGEHYFIDIIAAVPFSFGVRWFAERRLMRKRAASARVAPVATPHPAAAD